MDISQLMAQAQELQAKVQMAQDDLGKMTVKGIGRGGLCVIDMSGKYELLKLTLNPEILKLDIKEIEQIISDTFKDAKTKADDIIENTMSNATNGIPLPF